MANETYSHVSFKTEKFRNLLDKYISDTKAWSNSLLIFQDTQQNLAHTFFADALLLRESDLRFKIQNRRGRQRQVSVARRSLTEYADAQLKICNLFSELLRASRLWEKKFEKVYSYQSKRQPVHMPVGDSRLTRNRPSFLDEEMKDKLQK